MADETGAVAAEFAVALPAVLVILVFSLGLMASQVQAFKLEQAAALTARALGRGEPEEQVKQWLSNNAPDAAISTATKDGIFCATLKHRLRVGITLPSLDVIARSCVWVGREVWAA